MKHDPNAESDERKNAVSERLIVRHCANAHPHYCEYFIQKYRFSDLCRLPRDTGSKSKMGHFKDLVMDLFYLLGNLKRIRKATEVISIGVMAVNVAILLKLGMLPKCQRVYWFGLFIHSLRWLHFARWAMQILDSRKIRYILFSKYEKKLYARRLLLAENRMLYIPYGDLSDREINEDNNVHVNRNVGIKGFFFSGGDSNRDYASLIDVFGDLKKELIIVCSSLYTEINESALPRNVKVIRDVSSDAFNGYVKDAKACIIPIAHDTGAAGQSCLLRYMKNKKVIIATDTGIIREYITNGVSGILVKDNHDTMAKAILAVDEHFESHKGYADAAYKRYISSFSGEAIAQRVDELMMNQSLEV